MLWMTARLNSWVSIFPLAMTLSLSAVTTKSEAETRTHPKYGPEATRLYRDHEWIRNHSSPDFWALMPHYVRQQTGSACSIASATMILNGIRASEDPTSTMEHLNQNSVLERTGIPRWKRAVGRMGGGTTLSELQGYLTQALARHGLQGWSVEAIHAEGSAKFADRLHQLLLENEKSDRNFIMINFLQNILTGDPEGAVGHLAPIASYDATKRKVLVLDPDRQYYEPYWVSESALIRAMNTPDKVSGKNRGLLWIRKRAPSIKDEKPAPAPR